MRLGTAVVAILLAALVWRARPHAFQNRVLAAALFVEGCGFLAAGLLLLLEPAPLAYGAIAVYMATAPSLVLLYLAFLGTLDSPLARPLRTRAARAVLLVLAVLAPLAVVARMDRWAATVYPVWFAPNEVLFGPDYLLLFLVWLVVAVYGLAVSLSAWLRAAPGSAARTTGRFVALSFGTRDVLFAFFVAMTYVRLQSVPLGASRPLDMLHLAAWPGMTLLFLALLAYGILKTQLFDIDLKVRWTLKQGTVAGLILGAGFVASESAAAFFSERVGTYAGILTAGALVVAIAPVQRLAERVAGAAMPGVDGSAEYLAFRKLEVYKAAVESGWADGEITPKERAMLERLRAELAIRPEVAAALERDVAARAGAA